MSKVRVGVVRGGPSPEYEISLKTGANVIKELPKDLYEPVDIFIDREGRWHVRGLPRAPEEIFPSVDVIWNALHGSYGEDGIIQQILEAHKVPYTGSQIRASAVGMNKPLAKEVLKRHGIKVPYHRLITRAEYESSTPHELFRMVFMPAVVKPPTGGSSVKTFFAKTIEELWRWVGEVLKFSDTAMVEQHIRGREATVGVVSDFRGRKDHALIPIEIGLENNEMVWSLEKKYSGKTREYCPGRFSKEEKKELERLAILVHQAIGGRHYSRSDFILSPSGIYFLEINTLPGLTAESLIPKALEASGATMPQFLDHVLKLALARN